jgi:muconolactone D-isomerase
MLFHVQMEVNLPYDLDAVAAEELKKNERAMAQGLQRSGKWRHLWRIAGRYANVSVFDVDSPAELHDILSRLPLFPFMNIEVKALCRHGSSIHEDDC